MSGELLFQQYPRPERALAGFDHVQLVRRLHTGVTASGARRSWWRWL